jgi:hypothetical protein
VQPNTDRELARIRAYLTSVTWLPQSGS